MQFSQFKAMLFRGGDRHQGRINFQLTQIETVAGTGAKGLVRRCQNL